MARSDNLIRSIEVKRRGVVVLAIAALVVALVLAGASAGEQYERNLLEHLRQQNRLLDRQNELLRDQVAQVKRIADLMEKAQR